MYAKEMVKQSLPLLIISGIGLILAGNTFSSMKVLFEPNSSSFIPGLIVVIPAIIAMRGNISTAFGSRLGSAYHLGLIDSKNMWNDDLKQNIVGTIFLGLFMSFIIGILAYITSLILGIHPNPVELIAVVILAGVISGVILTLLTIMIIYLVFRRGYDPDNITGPALATFGDIVTMLCIFWSAIFIGGIL